MAMQTQRITSEARLDTPLSMLFINECTKWTPSGDVMGSIQYMKKLDFVDC